MFLAVHASIGALAGIAVSKPIPAFVFGFVSHFFTDMIPHGDEKMYEGFKNGTRVRRAIMYVALDALATAVLVGVFFSRQDFFHPVNVSMGIAGALLPDFLVGLAELMKPRNRSWIYRKLTWFRTFHMQNHHFLIKRVRKFERDIPLRYGLLLQAVTLAFLVNLIL